MFTGIVEYQANVIAMRREEQVAHLTIAANTQMADLAVGQSIAVNGVCLTVIQRDGTLFTTDLSPETLQRTTLGDLKPHERVNLERPLKVGDRFGGHFVTGHVDAVGRIIRLESAGHSAQMWISFPPSLAIYIASKGSIAVDGVSLTLVEISRETFSICLIPHTLAMTTLGWKGPGSLVNLEVDLLSRYLERLLGEQAMRERPPLMRELLHEQGFA